MEREKSMSVKAVLFDLDGTLLPMDQDDFTEGYFGLLVKKAEPYGYEPDRLIKSIWKGIAAMVQNDGTRSNEEAFWGCFAELYGEEALADRPMFEEFYRVEFLDAKSLCGYNPKAAQTVRELKRRGYRTVLSTNPLFPAVATRARIGWAGLSPEEFELYTTYENIGLCKPNTAYFTEIAARLGLENGECLVVGNDVTEDMAAADVGMQVFLLTDCLINRERKTIDAYPHGSFEELLRYADTLTEHSERGKALQPPKSNAPRKSNTPQQS